MRVLAIETSCDETGVAILEGTKTDTGYTFQILGNALLSQAALHAPYGGVYPTLAKREHEKNLPVMLAQAIHAALPELSDKTPEELFQASVCDGLKIDAIAVTHGPGLEPALWTGITFAQKLAASWNKPLLPINHMEGHIVSSLVQNGALENIQLPLLALLISGGHTELVVMREWFQYEVVGRTVDDAVGEAFDKVARMLDLPYPGGPQISKLAEEVRNRHSQKVIPQKSSDLLARSSSANERGEARLFAPQLSASLPVKLPRPMLHSGDLNFSFSGLKTAVLYALRDQGGIQKVPHEGRAQVAEEFENAVTDVLVYKTLGSLKQTGAQSVVIGGGVAANKHIRTSLKSAVEKEFPEATFYTPELSITGDNAIMIAQAALVRMLSDAAVVPPPAEIRAQGHLSLGFI